MENKKEVVSNGIIRRSGRYPWGLDEDPDTEDDKIDVPLTPEEIEET